MNESEAGAGVPSPAPDELAATVSAAQQRLEEAVSKAGLRGDPLGAVIGSLSELLGASYAIHKANALEASTLLRLEAATARAVGEAARGMVSRQLRRLSFGMGALVVVACVMAGAVGYWQGHTNGAASAMTTAAGLSEALKSNPKAAADWYKLIRANDIEKALASCTGDRISTSPDGTKGCALPLWLDVPRVSLPPT